MDASVGIVAGRKESVSSAGCRKRRVLSALLGSVSILAACAGGASAQEAVKTGDEAAIRLKTIEVSTGQGKGQRPTATEPMGATFAEPESPRQISQSISVVERSWIDMTTPQGTLDVLARAPGVTVNRSGGIGGQIYLRGFDSNNWRSSFYIDGDRFRGRNTLQYMLIAPEEMERVEIIRGPASVLYGSDALSGVVNVITRRPHLDTSGDWRLAGGGTSVSYGTNGNRVVVSQDLTFVGHGFDLTGSLTGRRADDYDTPDGTARNSDYKTLGGSIVLGYTPEAGQRWEISYRDQYVEDGRAGGTGGVPGYPNRRAREDPLQVHMGRIAYSGDFSEGLFDHIDGSLYVNKFYTELDVTADTFNSAGNLTKSVRTRSYVTDPLVVGGRLRGSMPWETGAFGNGKTTIGMDFVHENRAGSESSSVTTNYNASSGAVTSTTSTARTKSGPDTSQTNIGAYVLNEWTPIDPLTISLGGRYDWFRTQSDLEPLSSKILPYFVDNNDARDSAFTGGGGVVYRLTPSLDLVGNIGTSYRYPQNSEMFAFSAGSTLTIPNPELKPEEGVSYEGGFKWHGDDVGINLTAFHSEFKNLIVTKQNVLYEGEYVNQRQNVDRAEMNGLEVEALWQITSSINLSGKLTALRATDKDTGESLPYIAPYTGSVALQYAPPEKGYSLLANVDWAAAKTRISDEEYTTPSYAVANIYGRFDLGTLVSPTYNGAFLTLGVENLFDKEYASPGTTVNVAYDRSIYNPLVEPGRNFTLKLERRF